MEVFQIIGSIVLLVVGVAVILYVLFRKSPVKNPEPEENGGVPDGETEEEAEDEDGDEAEDDDIPEGDAPEEIERDET